MNIRIEKKTGKEYSSSSNTDKGLLLRHKDTMLVQEEMLQDLAVGIDRLYKKVCAYVPACVHYILFSMIMIKSFSISQSYHRIKYFQIYFHDFIAARKVVQHKNH